MTANVDIEKVNAAIKLIESNNEAPEWGIFDGIYIDRNTPREVAMQSPTYRKLRAEILGITDDR